ncbi:centriolin-like isoform X2 [Littorina saxatilis]|uniref:centriolin-like isoform X2 n=1 Tax=Littorina saxatilis TaxID=31220 RepID=UPI0038B54006
MRRGVGRPGAPSSLPVPKASSGSPSTSLARGRPGSNQTRSSENLSQSGGSFLAPRSVSGSRRAMSPISSQQKGFSPNRNSQVGGSQSGVRYITEELIRKIAKEENLDMITSLNLTLAKEGGKKIKYIENLDKTRKLQVLNLGNNMIERMEKLDKLVHLRELSFARNRITRIEGIENLVGLQVLNLSGNNIEHIPVWLPKKLRALRTFRIADNNLASLSEVAKLKGIPDLIQLEVSGNPLCDLPHFRLYIVFHLRCVEILDGQQVSVTERDKAQNRFSLDEVQTLERQVEQGESRYRQLEESHNRSEHERSQHESSQNEMRQKEHIAKEELNRLQQEMQAKDDLLKRKTSDLNKACEKHYQLEQELAFFKIDSKFQSLGEAPPPQQDLSSDDGGLLGESPYIGRARYQANKFAQEGQMHGSPQRAQMHSLRASAPMPRSHSPRMDIHMHAELDAELDAKRREVAETEEKLRHLQGDLSSTEQKLMNATTELKKMAPGRNTPEPFQDDNKFKIRQRLAKKMQTVNEMRDNATQMEDEIDRIQLSITQGRSEISQLKSDLQGLDPQSPAHQHKQRQMVDKEQQVNQDHSAYGDMQHDLESTLQTIAKETADIKNLEEQLTGEQIEQNESLKGELDDIVHGLQGYLEGVKGQSMQHQQEFQMLLQEKAALEEKVRRLEAELSILDTEATSAKILQKQLEEAEKELHKNQNMSQNLHDDLHRSRQKDLEIQDRLEDAEDQVKRLNSSLAEAEKKAQAERRAMEQQLQLERERLEKMTQRVQDANRQDLEAKKILAQLEAAKAMNTSLRDQMEDLQQKQHHEDDSGFKPSELKKRLRKFTHDFKTNKGPGEPYSKDDFVGATFKEIYQAAQDKMNKSMREVDDVKKIKAKAEAEIQAMKEKLKQAQAQLKNLDNKKADEEKKRMQDEINRLQALLKQLKEGGIPVRVVYAPSDGSIDRASSLDSEEKLLYDELQKELMDLKRFMRQQNNDASRKVMEAETEAAQWQDELKAQQQRYEDEIDKHKQEAELLREKQEARIQVIAQDLDQAQYSADTLQQVLNNREAELHDELGAADMSNQMISAQEDELSRLYGILEAQRGELENLNQMLDYLASQGPDGVGPGFDDELWRIRQEVNKLKETLAMQSAYVQSMPNSQSFGNQAGLPPPYLSSSGTGMGDGLGAPRRAMSSTGVGGSGFSTGMPIRGSASQQQRQVPGTGPLVAPLSHSAQSSGLPPDPRANYGGHLANERRETKAPPGGRSAVGRTRGGTTPGQHNSRSSERGSSADRASRHSADRSRRTASVPSAFEPVHRPEPVNPLTVPPSRSVPSLAIPGSIGFGSQPSTVQSAGQRGFQGASRSAQTSSGFVGAAPGAGFQQPGFGPAPVTYQAAIQPQPIPYQAGPQPQPVPYQAAPQPQPIPYQAGPQPQAVPGQLPLPLQSVFPAADGTGQYGGPQVAFDPVATQYSYSDANQAAPPPPGGYQYGAHAYHPQGPAQMLTYQPARSFVPASADGGRSARIYYQPGAPVPMPAPGAPPPPPPANVGSTSQGAFIPVVPIATGTPVRGGHAVPVNFDGSFVVFPPSPIRMESPTRGILKNAPGASDDSYLFCNVPEHHDLEDYIAELQEKLKKMKKKLFQEKGLKEVITENNDRNVVKRLLNDLEDRRDELEGLDLAIERQKRNLKDMKREERGLKRERTGVRSELETLREKNVKKLVKVSRNGGDDSFDEAMERSRQRYLKEEVDCLEKTLAKRTAQLREAERSLKETNTDLKEAKEQARVTVKRYDDATSSLHSALSEQQEIDRRANEVGAQLVKNMDELKQVTVDLKDLQHRRGKQERLLKDINTVISKKDTVFRELDAKVKAAQLNLQLVQEEVAVSSQREKETVDALRDSEDILSKRRAEIARMRDQVESQRSELERLDQQVGRKKTELQLLQESQERRQGELNALLKQAETELTSKTREIREQHEEFEQLDVQKGDLSAAIKTKRAELHKLQDEVQQEEEVLQRLTSSVSKNKSELKHTYEMEKLEQNELESLRAQHAQKMADLEKTQRELLEERSELEQLLAETSRKSAELDRLRQGVERERGEIEILSAEKQNLEERIGSLTREQGILEENCHSLDDKLNTMKRTQRVTEEKLDASSRRLEILEKQLEERERESEDSSLQRTILQKDVQMLKQNIKDSQTELEQLHENVRDAEATITNLRQDIRAEQHKRESTHTEAQRLSDAVRHSNATYEDALRQERSKQEQLQDLIRSIEEREREHEDARKALNRVRKEIEKEENKLNKLLSNANNNLEQVRSDLQVKQVELEKTAQSLTDLKKEAGKLRANGEQFADMEEKIQELEKEMEERNKEKNELANALSVSYEEVQRLRKESTDELEQVQNRSTTQVAELQALAEQQFKRASALSEELDKYRRELVEAKKQLITQDLLKMRLDALDIAISVNNHEVVEYDYASETASLDESEPAPEPLCVDKEHEIVTRRAAAVLAQDRIRDDWTFKHDRLRERLVEEQDYLRFQLQQQMSRHNEMMESARIKSDETIDILKQKLNSLQDVLFSSDVTTLTTIARSRSQSPIRFDRKRSPSPGKSYLGRRSRSRSFERGGSALIPEREYL